MDLVLASQSPRRSELLRSAGISFRVRSANVDETQAPGELPRDFVRRLARAKAEAIAGDLIPGTDLILGADTVVVVNGETLGKPAHATDAKRMLHLLSGRWHEVITGICLKGEELILDDETTRVFVASLTEEEIEEYVATGEPMDKAGAYAIQGLASRFIQRIEGSYSNVVGLPVAMVYNHLCRFKLKKSGSAPLPQAPPPLNDYSCPEP
jgi:septum formation protein